LRSWPSEEASTTALSGLPQPMVEAVELEARRAAARESLAAEQLVLHALEDPGMDIVARRGMRR